MIRYADGCCQHHIRSAGADWWDSREEPSVLSKNSLCVYFIQGGENVYMLPVVEKKRKKIVRTGLTDVSCHVETDRKLMRDGMKVCGTVPEVGSIILINEINRDPFSVYDRAQRLCLQVTGVTNQLVVGRRLCSEGLQYTSTFRKLDFLKGILKYEILEEPMYECNHTWYEMKIKDKAQ